MYIQSITENRGLIFALEGKLFSLYRYIQNHYLQKLNDTRNLDYLGHPINAYHFLRHVASGWKRIWNDGRQIENWIENNAGQIIWNNLANNIGKLKVFLTTHRNL